MDDSTATTTTDPPESGPDTTTPKAPEPPAKAEPPKPAPKPKAAPSTESAGDTPPAPKQNATSPKAQPSESTPAPKAAEPPVDSVSREEFDERLKAVKALEERQAKLERDLLEKEWALYLRDKVKDGYEDIVRSVFPGANPAEAKTAAKIDEWLASKPDLVKPLSTRTEAADDVQKYVTDKGGKRRPGSVLINPDKIRSTRSHFWRAVRGG